MGRRLVAVVLAAAGILAAGGCANHEKDVRGRMEQLVGHLSRNEIDACVDLMDPEQVARETRNGAKLRIGFLAAMMKLGNMTDKDVRIDGVTVGKDKTTADVAYSLRVKGEWKPQAPARWVRRDKMWYYNP